LTNDPILLKKDNGARVSIVHLKKPKKSFQAASSPCTVQAVATARASGAYSRVLSQAGTACHGRAENSSSKAVPISWIYYSMLSFDAKGVIDGAEHERCWDQRGKPDIRTST